MRGQIWYFSPPELYYTVTGGVPSAEDVVRAVDDLEALFASNQGVGRLSEGKFAFMKTNPGAIFQSAPAPAEAE